MIRVVNKKNCQFCQHNQYSEQYSNHLKKAHRDLMKTRETIRGIVKSLNAEQLDKAKQLLINIKND